jgi:probable HAF family extracellular repeat protein
LEFPDAVSKRGRVVGVSTTIPSSPPGTTIPGPLPQHGFSWTAKTGPVDIGTLGGDTLIFPAAVNARGQVTGVSTIDTDEVLFHAFLWTARGGMLGLGTLPDGNTREAHAENAHGQVVGSASTRRNGRSERHAFLWTAADGMIDLGALGVINSRAIAISAHDHVVGIANTADDAAQHALCGRQRVAWWIWGA